MTDHLAKKRRTDRPSDETRSILRTKSSIAASQKPRTTKHVIQDVEKSEDEEDYAGSPPSSFFTAKAKVPSQLTRTEDGDDEDDDDEDDEPDNDSFTDAYDDVSGDEESGAESDDSLASVLMTSAATGTVTKKRKRADPSVFATSMAKILSSHLTTRARVDPVLVRSRKSVDVIDESKLETKAKRVLALEKKREMEKGRVRDVLGVQAGDAERVRERERALRKIAQRGVVRMFNAVRAAQVKGEEAAREARKAGVVGMANREQKVTEMSKQSFLELLQTAGK